MAISIPRSIVEHVLLGPEGDRRQLQDSPVLGDVWLAYASDPTAAQELLITPYKDQPAGQVAIAIDQLLADSRKSDLPTGEADVAYLQGIVAARLQFHELLRVVMPLTSWWAKDWNVEGLRQLVGENGKILLLASIRNAAGRASFRTQPADVSSFDYSTVPAVQRFAVLAGIIRWAQGDIALDDQRLASEESRIAAAIDRDSLIIADIVQGFLLNLGRGRRKKFATLVYQVSLNRQVSLALTRSVAAVKADAARNLFKVNCSKIGWAVIDSGIQGDHEAFTLADTKQSRVRASFDFSNYRRIVSLDNRRIFTTGSLIEQDERLGQLIGRQDLKAKLTKKAAIRLLRLLAKDLENRRPIHWEFVRPFVEIKVNTPPVNDHGTHVAGIIGAEAKGTDGGDGVCPDISLYDFRVISKNLKDTEFGVIAALQFIRHLNEQGDYLSVHGANLSLSIPHDVRNYACGRTPVCVEAERLVESGVVVVAAAGNRGYHSFNTKDGAYDSYAAFSVTDPGNAEGVITVGSTHRSSPHTYGVSFFSSRGPTGDGRPKPDLVAPGERIRGPFRKGWGDLDGTSMAAPHVSGAAAMLLARYTELIGRPRRIKSILCESATDLGRERSFQGYGMLDVLRAFQRL